MVSHFIKWNRYWTSKKYEPIVIIITWLFIMQNVLILYPCYSRETKKNIVTTIDRLNFFMFQIYLIRQLMVNTYR